MQKELIYDKSGCNDCKHYNSKYDWVNGIFTPIEMNCNLGFDTKGWWAKNGHKKSIEEMDKMDCHEYTDLSKHLIKGSKILDEMLELLKK